MGLFSRFQAGRTAALAPAAATARRAGELWRRGDFTATGLGPQEQAIRMRGREPFVVPAFLVEFAWGCEKFRPLEAHIAKYAEDHGWGAAEMDALHEFLPLLTESGVLVSTSGLRSAAEIARPEPPPPLPGALGVSTGGRRWELLHRCLRSFHENVRAHGRAVELLVSENSADPALAAACREALLGWQRESGAKLRFAGEAEKRAFVRELARVGACAPEVAEFALLDPLGSGFSCGANRNALLLQEAGRIFGSLDDDVFCRLSPPPEEATDEVSCFSDGDPYRRWLFADRASARAAAPARDADYLELHHRLLGRTLGDALRTAPSADFAEAGDFITRRIMQQPPRIRATFLGHVGDPGIPTSAYYLYYKGENRRRLVESESHYRSVFPSRSVVTVVGQPRVGDATVSPGMAMGLDHRTLLPPFFPIFHAEDFSFGAALWQACPESVLGHLPYAIAHEPPEGKAILTPEDLRRERPFVIWEFAHLLRRILFQCSLPHDAPVERRVVLLGQQLTEVGELPPRDCTEFLCQQALGEAGERLEYLHRQLNADEPAPDYWHEDIEALMEHLRESVAARGAEIPLDLPADRTPDENRGLMQETFRRYGALMQAWPGIVEATQALRREGKELMPVLA